MAGIIVFPYGMQKLFGWSSAPGIKSSLEQLTERDIPKFVAWLIIIRQSFGSIALISGFLRRIAAGGLFITFTGALSPLAGWVDTELVWIKKGRGN
jgi:putative oxidoreductase